MYIPVAVVLIVLFVIVAAWVWSLNVVRQRSFEEGSQARLTAISRALSPLIGALKMMKAGEVQFYSHETLLTTVTKYFRDSGFTPDCFGLSWKELEDLQKTNELRANAFSEIATDRAGRTELPGLRRGLTGLTID